MRHSTLSNRLAKHIFVLFFALILLAVFTQAHAQQKTASVNAEENLSADESALYEQLALFGDVLKRVREEYVEAPENKELIEAALIGMLTSLDPHSSYLPPKNFDDMQVQTTGEFGGLGIEVTMEGGLVKVVAPIDDTPAQLAGILPNDLIVKLDGEDVIGLTLADAVDLMRGEVGTDITITVLRKGYDDTFDIIITRAIIKIKAVRHRTEGPNGQIGYIRLTTFNQNTTRNLRKALQELTASVKKQDFAGYILDLRNNPGGLLSEAITVSDSFLSQGEIVSTRGRNPENNTRFHARRGDLSKGAPVLVLINGGSASASEIVAGALQDHHRALIAGTQSFGKGSVQSIMPLPNDGALRLTTARYYTPSGRSIQALGIAPDIIINQELPEDMKNLTGRSEASLRGHLKTQFPEEEGAAAAAESALEEATEEKIKKIDGTEPSFAYVPRELEKDVQLQRAIKLLLDMQALKEKLTEHAPQSASING